MPLPFTLAENLKVVELLAPATDAAGRTGDYVSLKNAVKAWVVFHTTQGNAATIAVTPRQASAVAGTGVKDLTNNVPIWRNLDTAASDTLVRVTDAKTLTTDAAVKNKLIVFEIDPGQCLDLANGFDCLTLVTGASNVANITQAAVYIQTRFAEATPPAAITD